MTYIISVEVLVMALSEKKKASNAKWDNENLKRMSLAVPVELHERMQKHIALTGETMNGFIKRAISETMDRQKTDAGDA